MDIVKNIVYALVSCDVEKAIESFVIEQNDEITNGVREELDKLDEKKILEVRNFLNRLLNMCYDGTLFDLGEDVSLKNVLSESDLFLFKETVIYFLGRLSVLPDIEVLKKAYFEEDNKYIKLNLAFTSLCTFDEVIEMDFANKCSVGSEYDQMIRSWTMAYFSMAENPYEYQDSVDVDWSLAKLPRIKRLGINDESDKKYIKAMSFRLMDLLVLNLFAQNRNNNGLSDEEKDIVENADITYPKYSEDKKTLMKKLKRDILSK